MKDNYKLYRVRIDPVSWKKAKIKLMKQGKSLSAFVREKVEELNKRK